MYYYLNNCRSYEGLRNRLLNWNKLSVPPQSEPILTYALCVSLLQKVPIYLVVDRREEDFVHHLAATLLHCWTILDKKKMLKIKDHF